jgi:rubrerythrin
VFADLAEREGLTNIARLFRAASYSEQMHASNHLRALGGAGKTVDNLGAALGGETFEITTMYPGYMMTAEAEDEKRALRSMHDALEAEKVHAKLYAAARDAAAVGKDTVLPKLWVCSVCGFTMEGDAPERCPICGAVHSKFREF